MLTKTTGITKLRNVDISSLKEAILAVNQNLWDYETKHRNNNFKVFHHTEHILFKFHDSPRDPRKFIVKPQWEKWQPLVQPLIDQVVTFYNYKNGIVPKAMLAKLLHGHKIDDHVDGALRNRFIHKIHIPLFTNPGVIMTIDGQEYHLEEGNAYEVNNVARHGVRNEGDSDRIHLIFEYFDDLI